MDTLVFIVLICSYFPALKNVNAFVVSVDTKIGRVVGRRTTYSYNIDADTETVDTFLGIPYAESPVGEKRFQDSEAAKRQQEGNINTLNLGPRCVQTRAILYSVSPQANVNDTMSEDCLRVNIYTPFKAGSNQTYPVMVWFHGGSLLVGSANWFDGHILAQYGVVVVTVNYRLSVMGFLADGDVTSIPGDYGIFDQVLALKWVQENIVAFRGDAGRVTIFGSSAGAWSVSLHLLLEASKGLFHRAIVQSGPLAKLTHYHSPRSTRDNLLATGRLANCSTEPLSVLMACLRHVDAVTLNRIADKSKSRNKFQVLWKGSRVLPREPVAMLRSGVLNRVPVMMGNVPDETARFICAAALNGKIPVDIYGKFGNFLFEDKPLSKVLMNSVELILSEANVVLSDENMSKVMAEYFSPEIMSDPKEITKALIEFESDLMMIAPTVQMAEILRARGMSPYMYIFNHTLSMDLKHPILKNACSWLSDYSYHETELPFVFGAVVANLWSKSVWHSNRYSELERQLGINVMKLWTHFARYGRPPSTLNWHPFDQKRNYLNMQTDTFKVKENFRKEKVDIWINTFNTRRPNNV